MDEGTLVYSNTGISSTNGVVSIGRHTSAIYILNLNNTTSANVKLNGQFTVYIGHTPNQTSFIYHKIPGDYTTIEVLTAGVTLSVFAIG